MDEGKNMNHDEIRERLCDFLDGELNADERRSIAEHLTVCRECGDSLREWKQLSKAFFPPPHHPTISETELFVKQVMDRLPILDSGAAVWPMNRWFVPALAFSFVAFFLSFIPLRREQEDTSAALLLADSGQAEATKWVLRSEPDTPEDVVGWLLEVK